MANRYWVGNSGDWSDNTNHWSDSTGGDPSASLPTSSDTVIFDVNSFDTNGTVTLDSDSSCVNFFCTGLSARVSFYLEGNLTCSNAFFLTGLNSSTYRSFIYSNDLGTTRIISAEDISLGNVDFRDISAGGTGDWDLSSIDGGSGDCGGNYGITFTPSTSCFFINSTATCTIADGSSWFTESAGSTYSRYPLVQDDLIFDANSFTDPCTLSFENLRFGSIDMSQVDQEVTFANGYIYCYGDFVLGDNITPNLSYPSYVKLYGRGNQIIKTYDKTVYSTEFYSVGGKYTLESNFRSVGYFDLQEGSIDFNDYDASAGYFILGRASAIAAYLGTGTLTATRDDGQQFTMAGTPYLDASGVTLVMSPCSGTGTPTLYVQENDILINKVILEGGHTGYFLIEGGDKFFNDIIINAGKKVKFEAGTTETILNSLTINGTSDSSTYIESDTPGTQVYLNASTNSNIYLQNCVIKDTSVYPENTWYAIDSSDGGNNSGWIFAAVMPSSLYRPLTYGSIILGALSFGNSLMGPAIQR